MRRIPFLEAGVALATALSAGMLALMLGAPWMPQAAGGADARPMASGEPSPTGAAEIPPLGRYLLRGPYAFGPCLGLELAPPSYPVGEEAGTGVATVLWWERGMTGCDTRTGEVEEVEATVERLGREDAPDDTLGYAVAFELPVRAGVAAQVELTILAARSTQELLQAVDAGGAGGQGLVFDRVEVIDPPLDPLPSPTPVAALEPNGLYLLRGPFGADGPCLVLELGQPSYPVDADAIGMARIRWWERAVADPGNPAECLSRIGDVHEASATVVAVRDSNGTRIAYAISFSVPVPATGAMQDVEISVPLGDSTQDQLHAVAVRPEGVPSMVFDRVDSIDPPLAPAPSGSPGA